MDEKRSHDEANKLTILEGFKHFVFHALGVETIVEAMHEIDRLKREDDERAGI